MTNHEHPLFQSHPIRSHTTINLGANKTDTGETGTGEVVEVSVPYHIYDGYGAFIGGTADLAGVRQLLAAEEVMPVQNEAGRALMGIWLCDFTAANLGAHHELQISFFVSRGEIAPIAASRIALLAALLTRPDMQMMCHGLWNNSELVVAYNRELFSLNARLSHSTMQRTSEALSCTVHDAEESEEESAEPNAATSLITCQLTKPDQPALGATFAMLGQLGVGRTIQISRQPWVEMQIVNPRGVKLAHNGTAMAYTSNAANRIRYFDPRHDELRLDAAPYANLDFRPEVVQHMTGFKFVYEEPQ